MSFMVCVDAELKSPKAGGLACP